MPDVKILAVDDRPENLLALRAVLEPECALICASNGSEAVLLAQQHEFAAILLDVQMPVMDGFETAKLIRSQPRSAATPIIFVTAIYRDESYARRGYIAGAVDYIFKPLDVDVLKAKVNVFCDLFRKNREKAELQRAAAVREHELHALKEAVRARDEFLSTASHELKTPLTPLMLQVETFLQLAEEDRLNVVPREKLKQMLLISTGQVKRLSRLVNNLLDVSRVTEGRMRLEVQDANLNDIVTSVLSDFSYQIHTSGTSLEIRLGDDLKGRWDPFKLEQVVVNLLTNALKYGERRPVRIETVGTPHEVLLIVADQGLGIDPADQVRIFDRFERAVSSNHYGGLGIGLYIANQMTRLHGGSIRVESALGKGADFTVRLPRYSS